MYDLGAMAEQSVVTGRFMHGRSATQRPPRWTRSEREFLRDNANELPIGAIAAKLGRSRSAVKIKLLRFRIGRQVKREDEISLHDAGELMGKCGKSLIELCDRGIFPARVLPHDELLARAVSLPRLYRWAVQPENWVYFDAERIRDEKLRRLVLLAQSRWPDRWLTTGQIVERVNGRYGHALIDFRDVNRAITRKGLPGVRWDNWSVKASDVDAFDWASIKGGSGSAVLFPWNDACDRYVVLAAAVGVPYPRIGRQCGWQNEDRTGKRPGYRLKTLHLDGTLPAVAASVGAMERDGTLFADWRQHTGRFPGLARAVARWREGRETAVDRATLVRIVANWANWHADTPERVAWASGLKSRVRVRRGVLQEYLDRLGEWGLDPLGGA